MFVFLSKFLPLIIYPLGLACILLVWALLSRKQGWRGGLLFVALALLWLGGNRWVALGLAASLEQRYPPCQEFQPAGVLVLLGGGTLPAEPPRPMVEVGGAGDRVLYAAHLYQLGQVRNILSSGGKLDWSLHESSAAEQMAELLVIMGVPESAIWLESESRNTYENALYSARILRTRDIQTVLLVTSASHMPRAVRLFEAQGLNVIACPVDFTVTDLEWSQLWRRDPRSIFLELLPGAENLALTTRMLKEYLGILVYQIRGWE